MAIRTLDVDFRQIAVNYDEDEIRWHHRLLLVAGGGTKWVWATPDLDVQLGDLAVHTPVLLRRDAEFPRRIAGNVYAFDPLTTEELSRLLAEARALADVLGFDLEKEETDQGLEVWRVSYVGSPLFGSEVPPGALVDEDSFIRKDVHGLVRIDGVWTPCSRMLAAEDEAGFRKRFRIGPGQDRRLLEDRMDADGRRLLPFAQLPGLLTEDRFLMWPIQGPRSVKEFVNGLRAAGFESFTAYHTHWVGRSGVGERAAAAREHKLLCEFLRLGAEWDQVNVANLASFELATRRIYQIEMVVRKNPKMPDYEGLEPLVETAVDSSGAIVMPSVSSWLATHQKDEAFILKQRRLWSEELTASNRRKPDAGGEKK